MSLTKILNSKSARKKRQASMLKTPNCTCILSLTINMPGENKQNYLSHSFFNCALRLIHETFDKYIICYRIHKHCAAGPEFIASLSGASEEMKILALKIEDSRPWTRMLDIDIISPIYGIIHRRKPRKCLVCSDYAKSCARSQKHSFSEIFKVIENLHLQCMAEHYALLAYESLITELNCTPKPGLVDRQTNGSHSDLNYILMKKSAKILLPWFEKMALASSFSELRTIGIDAEKAMLKATNNINTHKGAIFCFGILVYCACRLKNCTVKNLSNSVKKLCKGITDELEDKENISKGLLCHLRYGSTGARGQAEDGYSNIVNKALPYYLSCLKNYKPNVALAKTLLLIISMTEDTCILSRSDLKTLKWAQCEATKALDKDISAIEELDKAFIEKNISPGGCADLLAITYFFSKL